MNKWSLFTRLQCSWTYISIWAFGISNKSQWGKSENSDRLYFPGLQNHCYCDFSHKIKRHLFLGRKATTNLDKCIKKQRHHFANKGQYSQSYSFSSSHVWMWELDHKEGWVPNNWCFWILVLEKTLEVSKEIKPGNPKGYQPWIFFGRTDTEAPILWLRGCEELTHRKRPWCWERLRARGEGGDRGWNGWMVSPTQWTWVWASSGR